jgi:hypothetical protein
MTGRMLTVAEMREIWGAKGERMSDAELEAIARRAYAYVRVVLETMKAQKAKA